VNNHILWYRAKLLRSAVTVWQEGFLDSPCITFALSQHRLDPQLSRVSASLMLSLANTNSCEIQILVGSTLFPKMQPDINQYRGMWEQGGDEQQRNHIEG
jgi:hypothetical protein